MNQIPTSGILTDWIKLEMPAVLSSGGVGNVSQSVSFHLKQLRFFLSRVVPSFVKDEHTRSVPTQCAKRISNEKL